MRVEREGESVCVISVVDADVVVPAGCIRVV